MVIKHDMQLFIFFLFIQQWRVLWFKLYYDIIHIHRQIHFCSLVSHKVALNIIRCTEKSKILKKLAVSDSTCKHLMLIKLFQTFHHFKYVLSVLWKEKKGLLAFEIFWNVSLTEMFVYLPLTSILSNDTGV